jgi:WD40 repeat protein
MSNPAENGTSTSSVSDLCRNSIIHTHNFFGPIFGNNPLESTDHLKLRLTLKINDEYKKAHIRAQTNRDIAEKKDIKSEDFDLSKDLDALTISLQTPFIPKSDPAKKKAPAQPEKVIQPEFEISNETITPLPQSDIQSIIDEIPKANDKLSKIPKKFLIFQKTEKHPDEEEKTSSALTKMEGHGGALIPMESAQGMGAINLAKMRKLIKPTWHAPWKLMRVISGHTGWVRCIAVDPSNQFFVTGSNDRTIKFWDLASGKLKLTVTGHISPVRGIALSSRHAYMYSCGEDKKVFCWDLETNKVVRNYHGHLSGVYCLALHPNLDVLATGGRDSTVRLWDVRTKSAIHVLSGHEHVISSLAMQEFEPQLISGSHDKMVRLWDIAAGKCMQTLTNHKKAIRSLVVHHEEYTFASGAADNVKVY